MSAAPNPVLWIWRRHVKLMAASLLIMIVAPYLASLPVRTIPAVVALASGTDAAPSAELSFFLGDRAGNLNAVLTFLVAAGGVAFALVFANARVAALLSTRSNRDLRLALHQRLLARPPAYLHQPGRSDMVRTALLNQTRIVASYAANTLPAGLGVGVAVFVWAQTLFAAVSVPSAGNSWLSAALAVSAVVFVLLTINIATVWIASKKSQQGQRRVMVEQGAFIGLAGETIGNLTALQLNVAEASQQARVSEVLGRMSAAEVSVAGWGGLSAAAGNGVIMLGIPLLVLAWRSLGLAGEQLAVMIPALLMLQRSIASVGSLWTTRTVSRPAVQLVAEMLTEAPHVPRGGEAIEQCDGRLVFDNVSWSIAGRQILKGVCLDVAQGETVAMVGAGGCGKSSMLQIALRSVAPDSGRVSLDGNDVADVELGALRRRVGLLEQHPAFFARTLRENLVLDDAPVGDDEILAAARAAHIDELVERIGLDSPIPEGGATLSGSEKRRLALTRLLLRKPDFLLIDELEAGLPQALAQELFASVREFCAGEADETEGRRRSCLIVTHRPDLLEADRFALLHEGCIVDEGSHNQLTERSAPYRDLLAQQIEGKSAPKVGGTAATSKQYKQLERP